jgi:hypothetical protein
MMIKLYEILNKIDLYVEDTSIYFLLFLKFIFKFVQNAINKVLHRFFLSVHNVKITII